MEIFIFKKYHKKKFNKKITKKKLIKKIIKKETNLREKIDPKLKTTKKKLQSKKYCTYLNFDEKSLKK